MSLPPITKEILEGMIAHETKFAAFLEMLKTDPKRAWDPVPERHKAALEKIAAGDEPKAAVIADDALSP